MLRRRKLTRIGLISKFHELISHKYRKYLESKVGLIIDSYEMSYRPRNSMNLSIDGRESMLFIDVRLPVA
jgi:hypothetical protein